MRGKANKILKSDSAIILDKFLESDKSRKEVAADIGVDVSTFSKLLNKDMSVGYEVARKIRNYFGVDAVKVEIV